MNAKTLHTVLTAIALGSSNAAWAGHWTPLEHQPTFLNPASQCALYPNADCAPSGSYSYGGILNANLLTDGSVLFEAFAVGDTSYDSYAYVEYKLTPDPSGSYVKGTWTQLASLPNAQSAANPNGWGPDALASAVLPDGRVIYEGGEYSGNVFLSSSGGIYDPVANTWQPVAPPSFQNLWPADPPLLPGFNSVYTYPRYPSPQTSMIVDAIGDSPSVVLPDGTFMLGSKLSRQQALLDPKTLTWTLIGAGKADVNAEEGWTLLPNGRVLAIDVDLDYQFGLLPTLGLIGNSEVYDPRTRTWSSAGETTAPLTGFPDSEIGPAVLMPDGIVFAMGGEGGNSKYDSYRNQWLPAPSFPVISFGGQSLQLLASDTGAALLPNGHVLASADTYGESPPTKFFEFDGEKLIPEPDIPNSSLDGGIELIVLPTGQILEFDGNTDVEIYTSKAEDEHRECAPFDIKVPDEVSPGNTYRLEGRLLNGVSQGAMFGDDFQMATNYPLVRITNERTHHVFYSRTHDFSTMAVANRRREHAWFDVPANQEKGPSELEIVANGIASKRIHIVVR